MKPTVTMREALADPLLLGNAIPGPSWSLHRTLLIAAFGEALTDEEREAFTSVTGRAREPLERVEEYWGVIGRRGGKTRSAGTAGAYLAGLCDWSGYLAPGERGVLPVLAASTYQAGRAFQHIKGILDGSPMLSTLIDGDPTADMIRLSNDIDVVVTPASFRTVRSITAIGAIGDEVAFWHIEGTKNPDREILNALRPALATTQAPLFVISSPYARRGELWRTYRSDYGPEGDPRILVVNGESRTFNSTLSQSVVDRAYKRDPAAAAAEYGGRFRVDVETLFSREAVSALVEIGVRERPRDERHKYIAFVDPSGGSSDGMTLGIAHADGDSGILDAVREVSPPFSPDSVVADFAALMKLYGISEVIGDRYGGEWPRERFRAHGINYRLSDHTRSELYLALLPAVNSGRASLLDVPKIEDQLIALERRSSRAGRDSVDHPPGGHDDVANAVAGCLVECIGGRRAFRYGLLDVVS